MFRGKWQRRKCQVSRGCLEIFHSDTSKAPNRVELVTCDMKSVQDDRLCFDVFSFNRTYHFQVSWHTQKLQKTKATLHDFFYFYMVEGVVGVTSRFSSKAFEFFPWHLNLVGLEIGVTYFYFEKSALELVRIRVAFLGEGSFLTTYFRLIFLMDLCILH